jgi:hypothetical protein
LLDSYDGGQHVGDENRKVEQEQQPRERSFIRELLKGKILKPPLLLRKPGAEDLTPFLPHPVKERCGG